MNVSLDYTTDIVTLRTLPLKLVHEELKSKPSDLFLNYHGIGCVLISYLNKSNVRFRRKVFSHTHVDKRPIILFSLTTDIKCSFELTTKSSNNKYIPTGKSSQIICIKRTHDNHRHFMYIPQRLYRHLTVFAPTSDYEIRYESPPEGRRLKIRESNSQRMPFFKLIESRSMLQVTRNTMKSLRTYKML